MKIGIRNRSGDVVAELHALVTTGEYRYQQVLMASFYGVDSVVRGVAAGLVSTHMQAYAFELPDRAFYMSLQLNRLSGNYRILTRPFLKETGRNLVHAMVIHESCVMDALAGQKGAKRGPCGQDSPVVIAQDGDIVRAVMERLSAEHNLPNIPEWYQ